MPDAAPSRSISPRLFSFPHPVDEVSARLVATGVVAQVVLYLATGWDLLLVLLAWGFVARVLTGPTLSPLGLLVTRVVRPRLGAAPREVPGPPKRFAQGIGAVLTLAALLTVLLADSGTVADGVAAGLLVALLVAASLEAFAGFCLGCWLFAGLMRLGVVPAATCEACEDLTRPRSE
ncbi:MAG: DUF4395 domain-containing protein [Acidimicrobiales bacterium]|jgi:hypothetical protein|nr:DUF4395 domain-containing protein [Acidimicrobiales bacterium]